MYATGDERARPRRYAAAVRLVPRAGVSEAELVAELDRLTREADWQALVSDGAEFPKNYQMTTSVNLSSKIIDLEETEDEICLILADLAGENLFEPLIEPHFDMIGKRSSD